MSIEENTRIASELHTALNNRDLDKAMALFADDASWIVMPGGTCYTKEDIRKYLEKTSSFSKTSIHRLFRVTCSLMNTPLRCGFVTGQKVSFPRSS